MKLFEFSTKQINRLKRSRLIQKFKEKKVLGLYVSEHLTYETQKLLGTAQELQNEGFYKFAWQQEGSVLIHNNEESPILKIESLAMLTHLKKEIDEEIPRNLTRTDKKTM